MIVGFCSSRLMLSLTPYLTTTVVDEGTSRMSGCWSSDYYHLQAERNSVTDSSGSSSSEGEETPNNGDVSGRTAENEALDQIALNELAAKTRNKIIVCKLIARACTESGLLGLWKVYKKSTEHGGFELISDDARDVFYMFVDTCLVHMVPKLVWNRNHMNDSLSKIFTIADEAFAMLVLENIAPDLNKDILKSSGRERVTWVNRKDARPKYTKSGRDSAGKMRGWRYDGIKRYNKLVYDILRWRKKEQELREHTEMELKKRYMLKLNEAGEAEARLSMVMGGESVDNVVREEAIDLLAGEPTITNWEEL